MKSMLVLGAAAIALASTVVFASDAKDAAQAMRDAKLSLTEAIRLAEKEGNGKAIDAEWESHKSGPAQYTVEVLSSDGKKLTEYTLDANTGSIAKESNERFEKLTTRIKPDDLARVPTSLSAAIRTAEQQTGGKVLDAETEGSGTAIRYDLKVAKVDGKTDTIRIDGATGRIVTK